MDTVWILYGYCMDTVCITIVSMCVQTMVVNICNDNGD